MCFFIKQITKDWDRGKIDYLKKNSEKRSMINLKQK